MIIGALVAFLIESNVASIAAANGPLTRGRPSIEYSNSRQIVDNFLFIVASDCPYHR